ncbi:YhdT family protein [Pontibacillus sp. ALD_SL1]|uniref:YhdT family protein n=1 Tax=Pontibacillus sp. ALD_SL1 TaxID=2777185 RepID=UPI001F600614|nr:YhdT family protein [Pontibacillus sp. ALD_SL1]
MDNNKNSDPRFKIAHREALIGVGLAIINFLWWYCFAYGLGDQAPEDYTYIWGLPSWFVYSCIGGFILMAILVTFVVTVWFKEVPFDEEEGGSE